MSSIASGIADILEGVLSIPKKIVDAIIDLPQTIFEGIKSIFIPDFAQIKSDFNTMLSSAKSKFGLDNSALDTFTGDWNEKPVTDISSDYNISGVGTLKLKFLDVSYLTEGVEFFRPVIKGLIVFLLLLYNYRMILSFIGQDPGVYAMARDNAEKSVERRNK